MDNKVSVESLTAGIKRSLVFRIVVYGLIMLLLLFAYFMASSLRRDRERRSLDAEREVSQKWGRPQMIAAPVLAVPLCRIHFDKNQKEKRVDSELFVSPDHLKVSSIVTPEKRYRGIYPVMLYKAKVKFEAEFLRRKYEDETWKIPAERDAKLFFLLSDVKGLENLKIKVNGKDIPPVPDDILSAPLKMTDFSPDGKLSVSVEMDLRGCRTLLFSPIGKKFELNMNSSWQHPSFTGGFLPATREITDKGFKAEWAVSDLNTSLPSTWSGPLKRPLSEFENYNHLISQLERNSPPDKSVGVSLVQVASPYQQVERVSNYALLMMVIVLAAFLIGENVTKVWIHPLQYFFAGLSLITFYVLLLALSEHLSFVWSYFISAVIIAGMTTLYCRMIFAEKKSAAPVLGGITFLAYILIFFLTRLEDYALLAGSGILLLLLAALMRATGNMNRQN